MVNKTCGRVYLSASLHDSYVAEILDALTDRILANVERVEVIIDALSVKTRAKLYFDDKSCEDVEVVQAPIEYDSPVLREFVQTRSRGQGETILRATAKAYRTNRVGVVWPCPAMDAVETYRVDDSMLASLADPQRYLERQAKISMVRLSDFLMSNLGSAILPPTLTPTPTAAVARDCPECYGTGLHKGWGGPCSRGCALKPASGTAP